MAYNFPNSPSNGDTVVVNGVTYEYNSTDNAWKTGTGVGPAITSDGSTPSLASGITAAEIRTLIDSPDLSSVDTDIIPDGDGTRDLGSSTAKWKDLYLSGNSLYLGGHAITADSSAILFPEIKIGTGSNQVTLSGGAGGTLQTGGTSVFSGAFADLTGKPTTVAGYGITDGATQSYVTTQINNVIDSAPGALDTLNELAAALGDDANFSTTVTNNLALKAPLASPSLTGTPTAPTATTGNNTTQIATTAFVQSAISGAGSYNDSSVDTHLNRSTAATGEVLSWNGSDYDWVARTTFSTLSGKPTTLSGYGITDGATIDSPAFTGTPTAPTASGGTNSTQIATTAYVQGEISSFSGGDSQIQFTADGAITEGTAVTLGSTTGEVTAVSTAPIAATHVRLVNSSNNQHYYTQKGALDYNDQDGVYQQFYQNVSGQTVGVIWGTNLGSLTFTAGSEQTLLSSLTPDNYFHINGTSTGILRIGTNSYVVTNSSGTLSIGSANNVGAYSKIITTENGDLIALNGSDCHFVTVSGTTITFGSAIAIGLTPDYGAFEWSKQYDKVVAASLSSGTVTYSIGTISGTNITWSTAATNTTWASNGNQLFYHVGSEMLISSRRYYWATSQPVELKMRSSTFNGSAFAFASNAETTVLSMGPGSNASHYITAHTIKCSKTDDKFAILTKQTDAHVHKALASVSSSGVFANELGATLVVDRDYGTTSDRFPAGENDPEGYLAMVSSDRDTYPSNNSNIFTSFFRTSASSTKSSYVGIAQETVIDGATVKVMLAGGISTRHTSLTPDTTMYVQDNGTISSTVSTVIAGKALTATSIQVADAKGTFDKPVTFSTVTDKPTTLSGYGITDGASTLSNIDIGSNDFITTGKSYYANMFATTGDLPSATTYHGMFAHVHGTGAGYFAHAGNWVELANKSYVDTEVANIVNSAPATLDTLDELAAALNDDANFATTVTTSLGLKAPLASPALTGTPTAPTASSGTNSTQIATTAFVTAAVAGASGTYTDSSVDTHLNTSTASSGEVLSWNGTDYDWVAQSVNISIDDLSDVDTTTSAPTDGQALVWNNAASEWRPGTVATSGGTSVTVSETAPSSPSIGDLWFDPSVLKTFVYYNDGTANQWVQSNSTSGGSGGGSSVSTSDTAPTSPNDGDLWLDTTNNDLFVYYEDTDSSQWIEILGGGSSGGTSSVTTSDTAPTSPNDGDLWFDTTNSGLFIYYQDTDSSQWIEVVGSSTGGSSTASGTDWKEKTAAYTAVAGEGLIVDTSTAVTVTLPASATLGDEVKIIDGTGNAATNNITVARNGHKINGDASDLTVDVDRAAFGLVYYNVAQGWLLTEK